MDRLFDIAKTPPPVPYGALLIVAVDTSSPDSGPLQPTEPATGPLRAPSRPRPPVPQWGRYAGLNRGTATGNTAMPSSGRATLSGGR